MYRQTMSILSGAPSVDVLLVSQQFYPAFTGAGIRFQRYAPGLRAREISLRVFSTTTWTSSSDGTEVSTPRLHSEPFSSEIVDGIMVQRVRLSQFSPLACELEFARALIRYCRESGRQADVLHLLSMPSCFWVPYLLVLRRMGSPLVLSYTLLAPLSDQKWRREVQRLSRRLPLQCVDCIVAPSVAVRDALRNLDVTTPIEVIPNGVDLRRFQPLSSLGEKPALRERLGLDPHSEIILFLGAFIKRKGPDLLLRAWEWIQQERPQAQLVFVGPSREDLLAEGNVAGKDSVSYAPETLDGETRVLFTGRVENVEDYLRAADILAFPSEREGMPNAVLEAYASGLAAVMTPFLGLSPELGRPGEEYVLVERTPQAFAEAVVDLLRDPQRREKLGQQARRWAEEHLDLETSLDRYAELYRRLKKGRLKRS